MNVFLLDFIKVIIGMKFWMNKGKLEEDIFIILNWGVFNIRKC